MDCICVALVWCTQIALQPMSAFSHIFIQWWQRLPCKVPTCSSGAIQHPPSKASHINSLLIPPHARTLMAEQSRAIWGSESCPWMLWHAHWRSRDHTTDLLISERPNPSPEPQLLNGLSVMVLHLNADVLASSSFKLCCIFVLKLIFNRSPLSMTDILHQKKKIKQDEKYVLPTVYNHVALSSSYCLIPVRPWYVGALRSCIMSIHRGIKWFLMEEIYEHSHTNNSPNHTALLKPDLEHISIISDLNLADNISIVLRARIGTFRNAATKKKQISLDNH